MELWTDLLSTVINENTLGAIILAAFFGIVGFIVKGVLTNQGNIAVARINSETTLGAKAMETLTTALEVLQEENRTLKATKVQLESHIETLIDYIIRLVKAPDRETADKAVSDLEQFLRAIGRWPQ
jgi:BioD-like phosphotransacetylase family protein